MALGLALASTLGACGDTAVELRFNLNVRVPDDMDSLCLAVGPVGSTSFARQYPIAQGGEAKTLVVQPGDLTSDRFEVIVGAELRRELFHFERRVVEFVDGEISSTELAVGGQCSAQSPPGTGQFDQQPRRVTKPDTATAIAALPAPGHAALVLAGQLSGGDVPRFTFLASSDVVATLEGDTPTVGAQLSRLLTFDMHAGSADGVCARDFAAITSGGVELWQSRGGALFEKGAGVGVGAGFFDGVARDLDGDGTTDLAFISAGQLALVFGASDGSYARDSAREPSGLSDITSIAAGFFDDTAGSGRTVDLVLGRGNGQKDLLLLNVGGDGNFSSASNQREIGDAKDTVAVAVVRSTRLGFDDIATSDGSAVTVFAQRAPGDLVAVGLPAGIDGTGVARIYGVDIDGDCARDLVLLRSETSGKTSTVVLFDNVKGGYASSGSALPAGREMVFVDFNGDGARDVVLSSTAGGTELYLQVKNSAAGAP
ncbi:MAG: VCBS repeat-containing protein [Myxococcales bacterium]|nr:VCBS repeat-containing protein [Myxococcales bacterium]